MSYPLLEHAPPHDSPEFIDYLRANNHVVWEDDFFLVIENCKYHRPDRLWLTAFSKPALPYQHLSTEFVERFGHLEWKKKAAKDQSVQRFHFHIYETP